MSWLVSRKLLHTENKKAKRSQIVMKRAREHKSPKACSISLCPNEARHHIHIEGKIRHLCTLHYEQHIKSGEKHNPIFTNASSWW